MAGSNTKRVILTADDYGAARCIDQGILRGIESGNINSVAAMVNFPRSKKALQELHRDFPQVGIGLHVSITAGKPLSPRKELRSLLNHRGNFHDLNELIPRIKAVDLDQLEQEIRRQIEFLLELGIKPDSLSSHHNVLQIYSPFFRKLLKLAEFYKIPLRSTQPVSIFFPEFSYCQTRQRGRMAALQLISHHTLSAIKFIRYGTTREMSRNQGLMKRVGVPHPDYLADAFWGDPTPANLSHILNHLPDGTSELVFHLGIPPGRERLPHGIDRGYCKKRNYELICLSSSEFSQWLKERKIQLVRFSDL